MRQVHVDDRHGHAAGEPTQVARQPEVRRRQDRPTLRVHPHVPELGRDDEKPATAEQRSRPPAEATRRRECHQAEPRQQYVERDLGAEAPRLGQAGAQPVESIDLEEGRVPKPVGRRHVPVVAQDGERQRHRHPVHRQDPQHAAPRVDAQARRAGALRGSHQPGPDQQEAGQDEEKSHAGVQAGEHARPRPATVAEGPVRGVGADDGRNRKCANTVQRRECRVIR